MTSCCPPSKLVTHLALIFVTTLKRTTASVSNYYDKLGLFTLETGVELREAIDNFLFMRTNVRDILFNHIDFGHRDHKVTGLSVFMDRTVS